MTLYLKYRPQKISELDLTNVRASLEDLIKSKNIPHALLFSGPRGTGKTSAARILAKIINCTSSAKSKPCNRCSMCQSITQGSALDVIEIDAASHRGIDDIRALKESIALAPSSAKKKLYIIDEVHMLTLEAANAFLKTLEEPPSHVMFILATTDPQRLPQTVQSRLTNIIFKKATDEEIDRQLTRVAKGEGLKLEKGVTEAIAAAADGSFRDAVKTLEALAGNRKSIKTKAANDYIFLTQQASLEALLTLLAQKDSKESLNALHVILDQGNSPKKITQSLLTRLHEILLFKQGIGEETNDHELSVADLIHLIELVSSASQKSKYYPLPQLALEIALIKFCNDLQLQPKKKALKQDKTTKSTPTPTPAADKPSPVAIKKSSAANKLDKLAWDRIIKAVKKENPRIQTLLASAQPLNFDGSNITLGVYYQFHKERLEDNQNRLALEALISQILSSPIKIDCTLTEKPKKLTPSNTLTETSPEDIIKTAEDIFT